MNKPIFLLPFAGGSSLIYNKWRFKALAPHPIEYGGHGFRYQEPLAVCIEDMVADVIAQIRQVVSLEEGGFNLFGHSMGGLIAWLTAQKLKPSALYVSACEPPGILDTGRYRKYGSEDALMGYISDYNRLSKKRMESKIFLDKLLSVIKNDYKLLSKYEYIEAGKLNIPIRIFCSREDTLMRYEVMQKWKDYGGDVRFYELSGDHFYIEDDDVRGTVVKIIEKMEGSFFHSYCG